MGTGARFSFMGLSLAGTCAADTALGDRCRQIYMMLIPLFHDETVDTSMKGTYLSAFDIGYTQLCRY